MSPDPLQPKTSSINTRSFLFPSSILSSPSQVTMSSEPLHPKTPSINTRSCLSPSIILNSSSRVTMSPPPRDILSPLRLHSSSKAPSITSNCSFLSRSPSPNYFSPSSGSFSTSHSIFSPEKSIARRVFPQASTKLRMDDLKEKEPAPVVFNAGLSFVLGIKSQKVRQQFKPKASHTQPKTASSTLTSKIKYFLKRTDHIMDEWVRVGRKKSKVHALTTLPFDCERCEGQSRSNTNIAIKSLQLFSQADNVRRSRSLSRVSNDTLDEADELTEMTADLAEEHSTSMLATERLESETSERFRMEKELQDLQQFLLGLLSPFLPPTATHVAGTTSYLPPRLTLPGLLPTFHRNTHCQDYFLPPTTTHVAGTPSLYPSTITIGWSSSSAFPRDGIHPPLRQGPPKQVPEDNITGQTVLHPRAPLFPPRRSHPNPQTPPLRPNTFKILPLSPEGYHLQVIATPQPAYVFSSIPPPYPHPLDPRDQCLATNVTRRLHFLHNKTLQQTTDRVEMELLYMRAADLNGIGSDEDEDGEGDASLYKQRYERAVHELEFTRRRLQQQHEDDLEQLVGLKKQLEKKLADAFEEVEEQRQVVGQWKRKVHKLNADNNDLRLLLEEQNARNVLLEKKQRKFDSESQHLQDELRQEKQMRDRLSREKELALAEKYSVEQSLSSLELELDLKEEKVNTLSQQLEELTFGGKTEAEVAQLKKAKHELEKKVKEQEEELDDFAGQVQLLEQAKLRLEMSLEQQRKENRREMAQRDEELEDVHCNAQKKVKVDRTQSENQPGADQLVNEIVYLTPAEKLRFKSSPRRQRVFTTQALKSNTRTHTSPYREKLTQTLLIKLNHSSLIRFSRRPRIVHSAVGCTVAPHGGILEAQLETEHEERTHLLREKHELERRLATMDEEGRTKEALQEEQLLRLRRDLRRNKVLLRDAQTMLERSRGDSPSKAILRQLRNQLEDTDFARTIAVKAKQALEMDLADLQTTLDEVQRAKSEAEEKASLATRERSEIRSQLEENEEELSEVLKKYRAAVQQLSVDQMVLQDQAGMVAELESERSALKEQLAELAIKLESMETVGDPTSSLAQKRLEFRIKELESKLELEQTTRCRMEQCVSGELHADSNILRQTTLNLALTYHPVPNCVSLDGASLALRRSGVVEYERVKSGLRYETDSEKRGNYWTVQRVQISRMKEAVDKLQNECAIQRTKEQTSQDTARKLQRTVRELRDGMSVAEAREAEITQKKRDLEKRLETAEAEATAAKGDLRLALKRIEDLQSAIQGDMEEGSNSEPDNSDSDHESDYSDESLSTFLTNKGRSSTSSLHLDVTAKATERAKHNNASEVVNASANCIPKESFA
uniref:Unconventional myosin-XVIIIa n=1 Tax=Timema monikensis TaxID=170555 RepID=A0A7R9EBV9_9NEOP|nr:unnamed protein product [Timema monikensis]